MGPRRRLRPDDVSCRVAALTVMTTRSPEGLWLRACEGFDLAVGERAEHAGQSPNRRAQVLLDGVVGDPDGRGDLRRRPVLAVAEDDARPLAWGQGRHRRLDGEPLGARVR